MSICILIVDDDRLVVEKLAKGIGWERIGIESVLTANNVRQAMKILEEAPVDILLSDIVCTESDQPQIQQLSFEAGVQQ